MRNCKRSTGNFGALGQVRPVATLLPFVMAALAMRYLASDGYKPLREATCCASTFTLAGAETQSGDGHAVA